MNILNTKYACYTVSDIRLEIHCRKDIALNVRSSAVARKFANDELVVLEHIMKHIIQPAHSAAKSVKVNIEDMTLVEIVARAQGKTVEELITGTSASGVMKSVKDVTDKGISKTLGLVNKTSTWVANKTSK